jgi:hypothetical protein
MPVITRRAVTSALAYGMFAKKIVTTTPSVEHLVVAGGGGGGSGSTGCGGGGAGGFRTGTGLSVTAGTSYTVTVGAGGAGAPAGSAPSSGENAGVVGNNSVQ